MHFIQVPELEFKSRDPAPVTNKDDPEVAFSIIFLVRGKERVLSIASSTHLE
jgi:hypothetical protein